MKLRAAVLSMANKRAQSAGSQPIESKKGPVWLREWSRTTPLCPNLVTLWLLAQSCTVSTQTKMLIELRKPTIEEALSNKKTHPSSASKIAVHRNLLYPISHKKVESLLLPKEYQPLEHRSLAKMRDTNSSEVKSLKVLWQITIQSRNNHLELARQWILRVALIRQGRAWGRKLKTVVCQVCLTSLPLASGLISHLWSNSCLKRSNKNRSMATSSQRLKSQPNQHSLTPKFILSASTAKNE